MNKKRWTLQFTLLELIVVMMVLAITVAIITPHLGAFFSGRILDDEARRLWAVLRHAREEAIGNSLPVMMWFDTDKGAYGLEAARGHGYQIRRREYQIPARLALQTDEQAIVFDATGELVKSTQISVSLHDRTRPDDGWQIVRQPPLSFFELRKIGDGT